jgi:hypothetical protein
MTGPRDGNRGNNKEIEALGAITGWRGKPNHARMVTAFACAVTQLGTWGARPGVWLSPASRQVQATRFYRPVPATCGYGGRARGARRSVRSGIGTRHRASVQILGSDDTVVVSQQGIRHTGGTFSAMQSERG